MTADDERRTGERLSEEPTHASSSEEQVMVRGQASRHNFAQLLLVMYFPGCHVGLLPVHPEESST